MRTSDVLQLVAATTGRMPWFNEHELSRKKQLQFTEADAARINKARKKRLRKDRVRWLDYYWCIHNNPCL